MEVLRGCESPIEMNSFDVDANSASSSEKQAMISNRTNQNSVHNNNNHITSEGMFKTNFTLAKSPSFLLLFVPR